MTMTILVACYLVVLVVDRCFYWGLQERLWRKSLQERDDQINMMVKNNTGLMSVLEDFKTREKKAFEYIGNLKAENEELKKSKTPPVVSAN